ncbi:hypothetical protein Lser_V15G28999 [Lactuca serriola]
MQAKYSNSGGLIVPAISLPSIYNSVYLDKPRCKMKLLFSTEIGTWVFVSEVKSTSDISTQGVNDPSKGLIGGLTNEALYSFGVRLEKQIELVHSSYRGLYALRELIPLKPPDHNVILVPCSTVELNCLVVDVYWCYILVQSTSWLPMLSRVMKEIKGLTDDILREAAAKTDGFSRREVAKLMASVQAAVYGSENCVLDPLLFREVVDYKVVEHQQRRKLAGNDGGD